MSDLAPDRDQIEIFIDALMRYRGSEGYLSLRAFFHDNKPLAVRLWHAQLDGSYQFIVDRAVDMATRAANEPKPAVFCPPLCVFNGPNGQAREKDLSKGLVLSVECDEHAGEARCKLEKILGETTAIVRSGGQYVNGEGQPEDKLHLHWRLRLPAIGDALPKLKRARQLATAIVGGDPTNVPAVHCLRWPGSWHRKGEPRLCELVHVNPDREIDLDEALTALEAAAPEPAARPNGAGREQTDWDVPVGNILAGRQLHNSLVRLSAKYIHSGMPKGAAESQLRALIDVSAARRDRPEEWQQRYDDIPRIVESAWAKFHRTEEPANPPAEPSTLNKVTAVFQKWFKLKDITPVHVMLGAVAANLLEGDPVWLGFIAPPSTTKTEFLNSVSKLDYVVPVATLTVPALLSGTPRKQKAAEAKGGLLRKVGAFGIMVLKDFGSILSMRSEQKAEIIAALREIFDGAWTRHAGSDGGLALSWAGKMGLIFACTETYDDHYGLIGRSAIASFSTGSARITKGN